MNIDPDAGEPFCDTCVRRADGSACDECWPSMYAEPVEMPSIIRDLGLIIIAAAGKIILEETEKRLAEEEAKDNSLPPCCDCGRDESSCVVERKTCGPEDRPPEEPEKCGAMGCWNHPCELEKGHDGDHCHENVGSTVTWWTDEDAKEWCPKCGLPLENPPPLYKTNAICSCEPPTVGDEEKIARMEEKAEKWIEPTGRIKTETPTEPRGSNRDSDMSTEPLGEYTGDRLFDQDGDQD